MPKPKAFAALILTHGRPDGVVTYETLRRCGYTGLIFLVVDNEDETREKYIEKYGDEVVVFDKAAAVAGTDRGDNFRPRSVLFARNASFGIAKRLGLKFFMQLDDDYSSFNFRLDQGLDYAPGAPGVEKLDNVLRYMISFLASSGALAIAMAQGGDFLGGKDSPSNPFVTGAILRRKCMNSFLCAADRPFKFFASMNDDVTTYVVRGCRGDLFFTLSQVSLQQKQTQTNPGGLTELYLDAGTYVKSFYTVMYHPSSVRIALMQSERPRLHHAVDWRHTVPKILPESLRKVR